MTDRLGNVLNIGDRCVCYNTMRTGSSTTRLVQYEAEIIGFTKKNIRVKCVGCCYSYRVGDEFLCGADNIFKLRSYVEELSTVDVVSVVRCKDCKWYESAHGVCNLTSNESIKNFVHENDFCSYGERKEPDNEVSES